MSSLIPNNSTSTHGALFLSLDRYTRLFRNCVGNGREVLVQLRRTRQKITNLLWSRNFFPFHPKWLLSFIESIPKLCENISESFAPHNTRHAAYTVCGYLMRRCVTKTIIRMISMRYFVSHFRRHRMYDFSSLTFDVHWKILEPSFPTSKSSMLPGRPPPPPITVQFDMSTHLRLITKTFLKKKHSPSVFW